ncbi:fibronectin type III domain-containing protein [Cellulophaga sp. E6(2014)]|uniref:fibronectin type III domain-containing protein n=1 Tax=Cellulophaga sp. E6(2014) TaxID=1495334 RepID=UPI00051D913A|nr:fibronectin type III domain-containing protein [Cellulophaga sp. E6(2014)]KGK28980.1 hypothetical protein EL45_17090 [Cellulophaga sp. E6(2014)]
MKTIKSIIIIALISVSCSKSGSSSDEAPEQNLAPTKVNSLIYPSNNLLCITNLLDFEWNKATDPNGDTLSYILEISKTNNFSSNNQTFEVDNTTKSVTLEEGTAYYWRVKAVDSKNLSGEYSSTFQFYTEGLAETNHIPFSPQLLAPERNTAITSNTTKLEWLCTDVDNDQLLYEVYLDTNNPPMIKIGDNINVQHLEISLNPMNTYYWKIIAKDSNGGQAIGQVWSFSSN